MLALLLFAPFVLSQFGPGESPYDYYDTIDTHCDVGLNLSISEFYVNDASFPFTTKNVVFKFSDTEMYAKYKPKLTRDTTESLYSEEGNMAYVSDACTSQTWPGVGRSQTPWVIANDTDFLYQTYAYGETLEYNDIPRPFLKFTVDVFGADKTQTDCSDTAAVNKISQDYKDIRLCWSQNWDCNLWFGNPDGYLYLPDGPESAAKFGFLLEPSWNVSGSHVDMVIKEDEVFTVPALSDETIFDFTGGKVPWMYFESYTADYFGYTTFIIEKGVLQRYVLADTFKIDTWAGFAFDLSNNFDQWSGWKADGITTWTGTIFESTYSVSKTDIPVDDMWAEPFNYPDGYEPVDFGNFTIRDGKFIDVTFTIRKIPTTVAGQTPAPTTPTTTYTRPVTMATAAFTCPKNCDGKGVCIGQNNCQCITNYVQDAMLGCRRNDEMTKATTANTGPTVTLVTQTNANAGTTPPKQTDKPIVTVKPGTTVPRTNVVTLPPQARPTGAPNPNGTPAPTNAGGNGSTTKSGAVTVAFELAFALLAVVVLLL